MTRAEQFEPLDGEAAERWSRFGQQEQTYYPELLGLVVEEVRRDYCRMRMPVKAELLHAGGVTHGGAIASLLDTVVVPAVGWPLPPDARFSTVDLHVQYIGALVGEDAVAEGWVTRRGRTVVFCESEVVGATSARLIARSLLTYNVVLGAQQGR